MKKTFDINRFWQVLKYTIVSEKKSIITAAVAFLAAFLAIQLFACFTIFDISHGLGPGATFAGMMVCNVIMSVMMLYYASGILGNARTSQQRVTALMLPASNVEKFLARLVYCCILMPVLIFAAAYAATGLRVLLEMIAGHDDITKGFSLILGGGMEEMAKTLVFSTFFDISQTCFNFSIFVLGGVFFHQRPFVWTTVTVVAGSILFSTLLYYIGVMIGEDNLKDFFHHFKGMTFETFDLIMSIIFTALTILNIWLSYWLYRRLQVVQHKWFNV